VSSSNTDNVERELKLVPAEPSLLDQLARIDRLGPLEARGRRHELQRNSFFDNRTRALRAAHIGFRRRTIDGQRLATWSLKADSELVKGVATRSEIEVQLDPDTSPAMALGVLRDTARSRGAPVVADAVGDALAAGGPPLARPYLETETDRTIVDLEAPDRGWSVELALDRMQLVGHRYADLEIEAELKHGDESALDAVRHAITELGPVTESQASKLSRAQAHLSDCNCGTSL
jgi:inorganic triphosphatase YgiF